MALLHLPSSPSTPCFSTDHRHHPHQTSPSSIPLQKNKTFSFAFSHSQTLHIKTKKSNNFVLNFSSSTIQDPIFASSTQESVEEEFSTTRLLASNVPWTCTAEDIRTLFEKFGTVLDVELSMHNKTKTEDWRLSLWVHQRRHLMRCKILNLLIMSSPAIEA